MGDQDIALICLDQGMPLKNCVEEGQNIQDGSYHERSLLNAGTLTHWPCLLPGMMIPDHFEHEHKWPVQA